MIRSSSAFGWSLRLGRNLCVCAVASALLLLLPFRQSGAQTQAPPFDRNIIVLDAAHGGTDSGARISDSVPEKDVTLELATRLRSLLAARGFTVISTRDGSAGAGLGTDQRADLANKAHAVACLVIHATGSGNGVQIGMSMLGSRLAGAAQPSGDAVPWDRAQEVYVPQSLRLATGVAGALNRANVPLSMGRVALRPLDNLMCPAVSVEVAPRANAGSDSTPVTDADYQQRIADAIAGALVFWRNQAEQPAAGATSGSAAFRPNAGGA